MHFEMGFRHKSTVFFLSCVLLIKKFHSKDISSTIPEQGSQICNVFLVSGIHGVPDEHLSASSEYDEQHAAKYGRINTTFVHGIHIGAWTASVASKEEFIQIFPGNNDQDSIKTNLLECPFEARYIRIHTWEFHRHPSMRFDLIGCLLTEDNSTTDCDFEGGLCGWTQETGNEHLYWSRKNYTREEKPSIPVEFPEFCTENSSYLAITTQNHSNSKSTFRSSNLMRFVTRTSTPRCLRLWSTAVNITSVYINMIVTGCLNQSVVVSSKTVNVSEHRWAPVAVDVRRTDYKLSINGGWTAGDQGYLAIDHVSLIAGMCPELPTTTPGSVTTILTVTPRSNDRKRINLKQGNGVRDCSIEAFTTHQTVSVTKVQGDTRDHTFTIKKEYFIGGGAVAGIVLVILTCLFIYKRCRRINGNVSSNGANDYNDAHYYSTLRFQDQGVPDSMDCTRPIPESQHLRAFNVQTNKSDGTGFGIAAEISATNPFQSNYITPY